MIAEATFGTGANHDDAWTLFRHPVAKRAMQSVPLAALDGATTSCGGWFLADAVAALAALDSEVSTRAEP